MRRALTRSKVEPLDYTPGQQVVNAGRKVYDPGVNPQIDLVKTGQTIDRTYAQVSGLIWHGYRTISEILAILVTSFSIGLFAGLIGEGFAGVMCAIIIGVTIGYVDKNYVITILGAPVAVIIGILVGGFAWLLGIHPLLILLLITGLGIVGALVGRRFPPVTQQGCRVIGESVAGGMLSGIVSLIAWGIGIGLKRLFLRL